MNVEKYLYAKTAVEAVGMLKEYNGDAMIIAGGTDLMLWLREGKKQVKALVDLDGIPGFDEIKTEDDKMIIGAGATHAQVAADINVKRLFKCLADGCRSVGSPQIRYIATVGGNIVSAQPAGDSTVNFVALDAECEIVSCDGSIRIVKVETLFADVGKSRLDPTRELMTKIIIPIPKTGYYTSFQRLAPRNSLALPIVNAAVKIECENKIITKAGVVLAPVATTPFRAVATEEFLKGKSICQVNLAREAGEKAHDEANPRDSLLRGSGNYRKGLVRELVAQAIEEISQRI